MEKVLEFYVGPDALIWAGERSSARFNRLWDDPQL